MVSPTARPRRPHPTLPTSVFTAPPPTPVRRLEPASVIDSHVLLWTRRPADGQPLSDGDTESSLKEEQALQRYSQATLGKVRSFVFVQPDNDTAEGWNEPFAEIDRSVVVRFL
jgi:hypothetical protein